MAICIPVVRLRCSEQRITGVVNKGTGTLLCLVFQSLNYLRPFGMHLRAGRRQFHPVSPNFWLLSKECLIPMNKMYILTKESENICLHSNARVMRVGLGTAWPAEQQNQARILCGEWITRSFCHHLQKTVHVWNDKGVVNAERREHCFLWIFL